MVLGLRAKDGLSHREIAAHLRENYDVAVNHSQVQKWLANYDARRAMHRSEATAVAEVAEAQTRLVVTQIARDAAPADIRRLDFAAEHIVNRIKGEVPLAEGGVTVEIPSPEVLAKLCNSLATVTKVKWNMLGSKPVTEGDRRTARQVLQEAIGDGAQALGTEMAEVIAKRLGVGTIDDDSDPSEPNP